MHQNDEPWQSVGESWCLASPTWLGGCESGLVEDRGHASSEGVEVGELRVTDAVVTQPYTDDRPGQRNGVSPGMAEGDGSWGCDWSQGDGAGFVQKALEPWEGIRSPSLLLLLLLLLPVPLHAIVVDVGVGLDGILMRWSCGVQRRGEHTWKEGWAMRWQWRCSAKIIWAKFYICPHSSSLLTNVPCACATPNGLSLPLDKAPTWFLG